MRHEKTLRTRIIIALFIGISASWMLIVLNQTSSWDFWQAWGLAGLGAVIIAAVGLRLATILDTKWFIRDCNKRAKHQPVGGNDPLVPCQVGHRQPYFSPRVY